MHVIYYSLKLFAWLWIQPSKWRQHVKNIDIKLSNNFALVDLNFAQLKRVELRLTLFAAYLIIPVAVLVVTLPIIFLVSGEVNGSLKGYLFVYVLSLCIGIYVSVPASVLFTVFAGLVVSFQWMGDTALIFDFTTSNRPALIFGSAAACIIIAAINHGVEQRNQSILRQIGAIMLGLIISIPLIAGVVFILFSSTAARQAGELHGSFMIWSMVMPPLIILSISVYLRTKSVIKILLPAIFCVWITSVGYGDVGFEYDRSIGGNVLLVSSLTIMGATFCMLSVLPYCLVRPLVGDIAASVTSAVSGLVIYFGLSTTHTYFPLVENLVIVIVLIVLALFFQHTWSLLSYLFQVGWNRLVIELDARQPVSREYFALHSVCWDEIQYLPYHELDDYLIASFDKNAAKGESYIEKVNHSNQQWAAQCALIELDARRLETLPDIQSLANTHTNDSAGLLPTSAGLILRSFSQIGQDVAAAMTQPSTFNQVLVLRTVNKDLEQLQRELNRNYNDKIANRFVAVAEHWRKVVLEHTNLLDEKSKANKEIPNPYTVGVPLTRRQKIFVGRTDIARFLEDILKLQDHPPLLLYGPRRMGKTSLLYQLHWMLPRHILTLIVDLQGPVGLAQDHAGFVFALARAMNQAAARAKIQLTTLSRSELTEDPFVKFDEWLNTIESEMQEQGCDTILLALDEFEALDTALRDGTMRDYAVLGMLRHISQHRSRIKMMLVGSHTLDEFKKWSSYFVNAQVIELGFLSEAEACQLIEQPIAKYPLDFHPNATQRVIRFTRGHPYLVQLACAELVALKNSQPLAQRQIATVNDIKACFPLTLQRGQQFFTDIEVNQMDDLGRQCLFQLATAGTAGASVSELESALPGLKRRDTLAALKRRAIIELKGDRYHFQVEAVALWFHSRNNDSTLLDKNHLIYDFDSS